MDNNQLTSKISKNGFSIIEAMAGIAVLSIIVLVAIKGIESLNKDINHVNTLNTKDNRVYEIIENIRATFDKTLVSFPINANSGTTTTAQYINQVLNVNELPMAWSLNTELPADQCPECPGRFGYVVTQVPGYGNLFLVSVIFTHKDWSSAPRKYEFMVSR